MLVQVGVMLLDKVADGADDFACFGRGFAAQPLMCHIYQGLGVDNERHVGGRAAVEALRQCLRCFDTLVEVFFIAHAESIVEVLRQIVTDVAKVFTATVCALASLKELHAYMTAHKLRCDKKRYVGDSTQNSCVRIGECPARYAFASVM